MYVIYVLHCVLWNDMDYVILIRVLAILQAQIYNHVNTVKLILKKDTTGSKKSTIIKEVSSFQGEMDSLC